MFHTRYFWLRVTFSNQYDLVPRNKVIFIQLLSEYPSNANNSFILCPGYQLQCYLPFNPTEFILLCNHPIRIHQSFFNFLGSSSDRNPKIKHSFSVDPIVTHLSGSPRTNSQGWSLLHSLSLGRFIIEVSFYFASRCWMWLVYPSFAPPEMLLPFLRRIFLVIINNFRLNIVFLWISRVI